MAKRFDPERLARWLAPFGFVLNLPEAMKGGISFIRASAVSRLYEHILIRPGEFAYVESVLSAATFTSCHKCVSESDERFGGFLNTVRPESGLMTWAAAQTWQRKLVSNADSFCHQMAADFGPLLSRRLQPAFRAVDSYIQRLGDTFSVFDREFAFVSEASQDEQGEIKRLVKNASDWLYLDTPDAEIASIVLVRFGSEVEGCASPFHKKLPTRDGDLAARMILLGDYLRDERIK